MTTLDVLDFCRAISEMDIEIWIDGGWDVDALLGEQTRPHKDLDIAIQEKDVLVLRQALQRRGYKEVKQQDARPWNFVLGEKNGREIDVHVIVLDDNGNGIYGPPEKGEMYPTASLCGTGMIMVEPFAVFHRSGRLNFIRAMSLKKRIFGTSLQSRGRAAL